ncbi:MAG: cyclopropane fatty acyl phospholipid synthase [Deferrisomatales bacterium]|nr:cyclopropane fatty acyl phospholipid synthase [Deferrisomatales bacterium]
MHDTHPIPSIPDTRAVPLYPRPLLKRTSQVERYFEQLLANADIRINGDRPWDMRVHDRSVFAQVIANGSIALGESYMAGAWDCERLDEFFCRVLSARLEEGTGRSLYEIWLALKARALNIQRGQRAYAVGRRHYDLGNEFFGAMLDSRMTYSCGYWKKTASLEAAQEAKLDLICRKIGLQRGQRILDIGCGWGSFAGYAAERYGARVVGVTVSVEQARLANARYAKLPVEVRVQDYRQLNEPFDHVVSVGMFEHVGFKNYRRYMEVVARCLRDQGAFLLHTIGQHKSVRSVDPWIEKYIFPNSMTPSPAQITAAADGLFCVRDWHGFGQDYDPTLRAWHENFQRNWHRFRKGLSKPFQRMWSYYLLSCAGSFRADDCQLWQIVFSKPGTGMFPVSVR